MHITITLVVCCTNLRCVACASLKFLNAVNITGLVLIRDVSGCLCIVNACFMDVSVAWFNIKLR